MKNILIKSINTLSSMTSAVDNINENVTKNILTQLQMTDLNNKSNELLNLFNTNENTPEENLFFNRDIKVIFENTYISFTDIVGTEIVFTIEQLKNNKITYIMCTNYDQYTSYGQYNDAFAIEQYKLGIIVQIDEICDRFEPDHINNDNNCEIISRNGSEYIISIIGDSTIKFFYKEVPPPRPVL